MNYKVLNFESSLNLILLKIKLKWELNLLSSHFFTSYLIPKTKH